MSGFEAKPNALLRPFVECYWGRVRDLAATGGFTVTPDRFLELIFFVDPPAAAVESGSVALSDCILIPLLSRPLRLVTHGIIRCTAVRLHAWAGGFVLPETRTGDPQWYDASSTFAGTLPAIAAALRAEAWAEIPSLLDAALLHFLARCPPSRSAHAAVRAFVEPTDPGSAQAAPVVASQQGISRRQLERQVRQLTSRSPKQLSCLARFQFGAGQAVGRAGGGACRPRFEAGYADQAHLTRHFRRYAAQTPGEFIRESARRKRSIRADDVAFVQDAANTAK